MKLQDARKQATLEPHESHVAFHSSFNHARCCDCLRKEQWEKAKEALRQHKEGHFDEAVQLLERAKEFAYDTMDIDDPNPVIARDIEVFLAKVKEVSV